MWDEVMRGRKARLKLRIEVSLTTPQQPLSGESSGHGGRGGVHSQSVVGGPTVDTDISSVMNQSGNTNSLFYRSNIR